MSTDDYFNVSYSSATKSEKYITSNPALKKILQDESPAINDSSVLTPAYLGLFNDVVKMYNSAKTTLDDGSVVSFTTNVSLDNEKYSDMTLMELFDNEHILTISYDRDNDGKNELYANLTSGAIGVDEDGDGNYEVSYLYDNDKLITKIVDENDNSIIDAYYRYDEDFNESNDIGSLVAGSIVQLLLKPDNKEL